MIVGGRKLAFVLLRTQYLCVPWRRALILEKVREVSGPPSLPSVPPKWPWRGLGQAINLPFPGRSQEWTYIVEGPRTVMSLLERLFIERPLRESTEFPWGRPGSVNQLPPPSELPSSVLTTPCHPPTHRPGESLGRPVPDTEARTCESPVSSFPSGPAAIVKPICPCLELGAKRK